MAVAPQSEQTTRRRKERCDSVAAISFSVCSTVMRRTGGTRSSGTRRCVPRVEIRMLTTISTGATMLNFA